MQKILRTSLVLLVALFALTVDGKAVEESPVPDWVRPVYPEREMDKISRKSCRGLTNVLTGWGEIPRQIIRSYGTDGPLLFLPLGLCKGAIMTLARTGVGVFEFILPFDAATGNYDPILLPPYVWQYYAPPEEAAEPQPEAAPGTKPEPTAKTAKPAS